MYNHYNNTSYKTSSSAYDNRRTLNRTVGGGADTSASAGSTNYHGSNSNSSTKPSSFSSSSSAPQENPRPTPSSKTYPIIVGYIGSTELNELHSMQSPRDAGARLTELVGIPFSKAVIQQDESQNRVVRGTLDSTWSKNDQQRLREEVEKLKTENAKLNQVFAELSQESVATSQLQEDAVLAATSQLEEFSKKNNIPPESLIRGALRELKQKTSDYENRIKKLQRDLDIERSKNEKLEQLAKCYSQMRDIVFQTEKISSGSKSPSQMLTSNHQESNHQTKKICSSGAFSLDSKSPSSPPRASSCGLSHRNGPTNFLPPKNQYTPPTPPPQPKSHVILKYLQKDLNSGRITQGWLPSLESAFERLGNARGRPVSVSIAESSNFPHQLERVQNDPTKKLVGVWLLIPTCPSGFEAKPPLSQAPLPDGVSERYMELGNLCSNDVEKENVDVVVFNDEKLTVDESRTTRSYNGNKAWNSIFERIPKQQQQQSHSLLPPVSSGAGIGGSKHYNGVAYQKDPHENRNQHHQSVIALPKVTVHLVVDPSVISQGMIRDSWLTAVSQVIKTQGKTRNVDVTVEVKRENHNSYAAAYGSSSGVMTFYVVSAKLDREPFPPNRSHLELGYMVSERGDCDSIAMNDHTENVDVGRITRSYNGANAWNKIMEKVVAKKS